MSNKPDWHDKVSDFSSPSSANPVSSTIKQLYLGLLAPPFLGVAVFAAGAGSGFARSFGAFILCLAVFLLALVGYCFFAFFAVKKLQNTPIKIGQRCLISTPIFIAYGVTAFGVLFCLLSPILKINNQSAIEYSSLFFGLAVAIGATVFFNLKYLATSNHWQKIKYMV